MKVKLCCLHKLLPLFIALFYVPIATDLIYLGMVDVSGPGSPDMIASVADQLKSLPLTKANVVNFKASKDGLTVTDTVSG